MWQFAVKAIKQLAERDAIKIYKTTSKALYC
jgi:hypothetical protein